MDRKELEAHLKPFFEKCAQDDYPIEYELCAAYPGDVHTSYIIQIKAPWVDAMDCNEALSIIIDRLWDTVEENIREKIFAINILDSHQELHCSQDLESRN